MSAPIFAACRPLPTYPVEYRPTEERRMLLTNVVVSATNVSTASMTARVSFTPTLSLSATTQTIDGVEVVLPPPLLNGFYKR